MAENLALTTDGGKRFLIVPTTIVTVELEITRKQEAGPSITFQTEKTFFYGPVPDDKDVIDEHIKEGEDDEEIRIISIVKTELLTLESLPKKAPNELDEIFTKGF